MWTEAGNDQLRGRTQRRIYRSWQPAAAHLVCIIHPEYSQGCTQPAADVSEETCADPLLTEPNSQDTQTKPAKESCLSSSLCGADNFLSQICH